MPANGEERKIELIGTSGTPSPTVESKKIPADRDVEDAVPYRISEKISANRNVGDAVPYGKTEKISANRDVGDAVPYGKIEKNIGESGRQHLVTFGVLRKDAVPYGKIEKRTPSPR